MKIPKYLVVIGASAGGFKALDQLIKQLDPANDAAYCIALHFSDHDIGKYLVGRLHQLTNIPCGIPEDGETLHTGHIYICPPGKQLIIEDRKILLGEAPGNHFLHPTINTLFRSAAAAFDGYTIGIILTGLIQDGVDGMNAIRQCGGTLIVQDPAEAEYPDLPASILTKMPVDYTLKLAGMGPAITDIIQNGVVVQTRIPDKLIADLEQKPQMSAAEKEKAVTGDKSNYSCPDCGGTLYRTQKESGENNYRCQRGHHFSESELMVRQIKNAESAIWVAVRIMEERNHLLMKLAEECNETFPNLASDYSQRATDMEDNVKALKDMLSNIEHNQKVNGNSALIPG